jgi:N-acetylmuramoyl-L-alanine amidase
MKKKICILNKFTKIIFSLFLLSGLTNTLLSAGTKNEPIDSIPEYKIALSPGHGGKDEFGRKKTGDSWYYPAQKFCRGYSSGTRHKNLTEEKIVQNIGQSIKKILDLTRTDKGWTEFKKLLTSLSKQKYFKRIMFNTELIRSRSWKDLDEKEKSGDSNRYIRMFDSPADYDKKGPKGIYYGRLSRINIFRPHLLVPLHLNTSGSKKWRGMHTVITPPYHIFKEISDAWKINGLKGIEKLKNPWLEIWNNSSSSRTRASWAANDCSTYFTGRRLNKHAEYFSNTFIGIRHLMVSWTFNSFPMYLKGFPEKTKNNWPYLVSKIKKPFSQIFSNPFLEREKSRFEKLRRSGGPLKFGGHNHYAGLEIIKFTRLWLYKCLKTEFEKNNKTPFPDCREITGPILPPAVSDWSEPMLTNAVTAYLELGLITNKQDRLLLLSYPKRFAQGIALGIYSLFSGLNPINPKGADQIPKGEKIDWNLYNLNHNEQEYYQNLMLRAFDIKNKNAPLIKNWFDCTWMN